MPSASFGCQGLLYLNVHYSVVVLKLLSYIRCRFERLVLKPKYVKQPDRAMPISIHPSSLYSAVSANQCTG